MDRRLTESIWCTGKDSNLRTSLGGTDLQSVGFNHSPTCAKNPGRCGRCAPSSRPPCKNAGTAQRKNPQTNPFYFRKTGKPRLAQKIPRRSLHAGKFPNGVCLEKPAAPLPSPPNRRNIRLPVIVLWSWRRDLNPRPPDYKSGALPTELRQQFGKDAPSRKLIPLIPARCPGQLIKLSQWELLAQAWGPSWVCDIRVVNGGFFFFGAYF
jgi:hypothetical protein